MLRKRIISAIWIAALFIVAIWFGDPGYTVFIAAIGILGAFEFYRMVTGIKIQPLTYVGIAFILLIILSRNQGLLSLISPVLNIDLLTPLLIAFALAIPLIWLLRRSNREETVATWAWTVAGIFYLGYLLSLLVALRGFEEGRNWVFLAVITTFVSDTAAFFIGKTWGNHLLLPRISPAKTWEGAIGGVASAICISLLFVLPTPLSLQLSYGQAIPLAILVSVSGQLGDLFESFIKRTTGVKDSGTLIPGHGGILDRMDSIMFAGLAVYLYVLIFLP